jgi:hypothetical protein
MVAALRRQRGHDAGIVTLAALGVMVAREEHARGFIAAIWAHAICRSWSRHPRRIRDWHLAFAAMAQTLPVLNCWAADRTEPNAKSES